MESDMVSALSLRVALMRRLGIRRLDMGGVEIELDPVPPASAEAAPPLSPSDLDALLDGAPEGDDALFWSTTGPLPSEYRDASKSPEE